MFKKDNWFIGGWVYLVVMFILEMVLPPWMGDKMVLLRICRCCGLLLAGIIVGKCVPQISGNGAEVYKVFLRLE